MLKSIHPIAGGLAMLTIATFWLSTAIAEIFATAETVATVKIAIPWGFLVLIPALMTAAASGFSLTGGKNHGLIGRKKKRMPLVALNGLFILMPAALFLAAKAQAAAFDTTFYTVQAVELVAGLTNLILLGLQARDGLALRQNG